MKNIEVYNGLEVPYEFLPNFTPTPNVDKSNLITLDDLKNAKLVEVEHLKDKEEWPSIFKDKEID